VGAIADGVYLHARGVLVAPAALAYDLVMKRLLILVLVFSTAVALLSAEEPDEAVPLFPNLELSSLDGQSTVDIESFRGRPLLLTFWASWCGPCRVELPELEELYGELVGKGFVLMTVNVDSSPKLAERFLASTGINVPVYRADPMMMRNLGINSLPTSILLDPDGRPATIYNGYHDKMSEHIRELVLKMYEERTAAKSGGNSSS